MKKTPFRVAIVAGVAAVALSFLGAPAAFAAGPPVVPGSELYTLDYSTGSLYSVDAATGASTPIGSTSGHAAGQAAWDAVSHTAYFVDWGNGGYQLSKMDRGTGIVTVVGSFRVGVTNTAISAIAINKDGDAYALGAGALYKLDLSSGALTFVGASSFNILGFAANPNTGVFYTINTVGAISTIDVTTGVLTSLGTPAIPAPHTYSLQVDTNGMLWVENDSPSTSDLWSVNPASVTTSAVRSGALNVVGTVTESLLLVPGPMAATVTPTATSLSVSAFQSAGFSARYTGFLPGEAIELYISASQSGGGGIPSSYVADSSGGVTVNYVGLAAEGIDDYTLVAVGTVSGVFARADFSVVANPVAVAAPALAATGTNATPVLLVGAALLLGGAAFGTFALIHRRRSRV